MEQKESKKQLIFRSTDFTSCENMYSLMFNSLSLVHCDSLMFSMLSEDHNFLSAVQSFGPCSNFLRGFAMMCSGSRGWTFDP